MTQERIKKEDIETKPEIITLGIKNIENIPLSRIDEILEKIDSVLINTHPIKPCGTCEELEDD